MRFALSSVRQIAPVEGCIILADFLVPRCEIFCQISVMVKYVHNRGICNPYKLITFVWNVLECSVRVTLKVVRYGISTEPCRSMYNVRIYRVIRIRLCETWEWWDIRTQFQLEISTERNKLEEESWDVKTIIKRAYRSLVSRLKSNYSDSDRDECWVVVERVTRFGIS
jgi:hypothetical protein